MISWRARFWWRGRVFFPSQTPCMFPLLCLCHSTKCDIHCVIAELGSWLWLLADSLPDFWTVWHMHTLLGRDQSQSWIWNDWDCTSVCRFLLTLGLFYRHWQLLIIFAEGKWCLLTATLLLWPKDRFHSLGLWFLWELKHNVLWGDGGEKHGLGLGLLWKRKQKS